MSIEYVEIRDTARELIGFIDVFRSVIWHDVYYGVGDFEIYAQATPQNIELLQRGNYVTRPDNDNVGIILRINPTTTEQDGKMIVASGHFTKILLNRRLIYNLNGHSNAPTILRGNVETAARQLVYSNAINCSFDALRNFDILELGAIANLPAVIRDESGRATQKQVSYQNLLDYSDGLLQEYAYGARVILNDDTKKLQYVCYSGEDRHENIVFSQEFDNLVESDYIEDESELKNVALIGGEGEGTARFYSLLKTVNASGIYRRETWVDASSINKTYKEDGDEEEHTYTDAEYTEMLNAQGLQELAPQKLIIAFNGVINTSYGQYVLNRDFFIGDEITVQDNDINKYATVRITEVTEIQDENGYTCEAKYE